MIELTSLRSTSNLHPNVAIEHHIQLHSTIQYVDDAVVFFSYRRTAASRETSLSTRHITSLAHIIEGHPYLYHTNSESIFTAPHHSILDGLLREYQLVCWLLSLPFYEPIIRDIGIISPIFHLPINLPSTSSDYYSPHHVGSSESFFEICIVCTSRTGSSTVWVEVTDYAVPDRQRDNARSRALPCLPNL